MASGALVADQSDVQGASSTGTGAEVGVSGGGVLVVDVLALAHDQGAGRGDHEACLVDGSGGGRLGRRLLGDVWAGPRGDGSDEQLLLFVQDSLEAVTRAVSGPRL